MKGNILIVEDNRSVLAALEMLLSEHFEHVEAIKHPKTLLNCLGQQNYDVVLLDMNFQAGSNTGNEGIFWLSRIKEAFPAISVVMITAHGDVELAVKAVKEGAFDFVLKPWENNKLIATLSSAVAMKRSKNENSQLKERNRQLKDAMSRPSVNLIGQSAAMKKLLTLVDKVAATDANILIIGENGTGKELIANEIHKKSKRSNEVLVNVDMGAISETLFESELFGHAKGAFTDARENRAGKIETAHKGTLFLDEIGNLPPGMQQKMLVALQNRTVTRLGTNNPINVDIRLISATNKNLEEMVDQGQFREDLLYRINTIAIEIPPLRHRDNDVLLLAEYYLLKYSQKYDKERLKLSENTQKELMEYHWPGNVRELQHTMEKAVILCDGTMIEPIDLGLKNNKSAAQNIEFKSLEEMERILIANSIEKEGGNMSLVAKNLGITRQTLYNKIKKYDL